ncbi:MAG: hypothetical protein ACOCV2_07545, partial [Persicimonas sp.]
DAAAVQFTRNPGGLAGALKKVGGYAKGSKVTSKNAPQVSHLFFGDPSGRSRFTRFFAAHPPLKARIVRLDPSFDGEFPTLEPPDVSDSDSLDDPMDLEWSTVPSDTESGASAYLAADGGLQDGHPPNTPIEIDADGVLASSGQIDPEHLGYARGVLQAIPNAARRATDDPSSAAALVFALLLDDDEGVRKNQLDLLREELREALTDEVADYAQLLDDLDAHHRLPLAELTVPALRELSNDQHAQFVDILDALILADDRVDHFEFALEKLVTHRLDAGKGGTASRRRAQFYSLKPLEDEVELLLSFLAHAGHDDEPAAQSAFDTGFSRLNRRVRGRLELRSEEECTFEALDPALDRIAKATSGVKEHVVDAATHCALADEEITVDEAELLRALCEVIDVPLPPFLSGHRHA